MMCGFKLHRLAYVGVMWLVEVHAGDSLSRHTSVHSADPYSDE
jgi:hypothetical protein